jgi:hypothetical protein
MRSNRLLSITAILAIALFAVTFIELFDARVQSGDVYPVYSSLRSDAGGTKAYYDSINRLEGLAASRRFEPLAASRLSGSTIFLLGVSPQAIAANSSTYQKVAANGNRVVIGLPVCSGDAKTNDRTKQQVRQPWGLEWECVERGSDENLLSYAPDYYALSNVGRQWQAIAFDRDGRPIATEQAAGSGSLVLVTDTYALTNEALLRDRKTDLLARLLGHYKLILFDEHHLGVGERYGVVSLARQYRLHGFVAGLLLIAALFIWRNASSFLPRIAGTEEEEISGRAASSGLTNLLGRAISPSELLNTCVAEWKRSLGKRVPEEQVAQVMKIATSAQAGKDPPVSYREIAQLVSERRRR